MKWKEVPRLLFAKSDPAVKDLPVTRIETPHELIRKGKVPLEDATVAAMNKFFKAFDEEMEECSGYGIVVFEDLTSSVKTATEKDHYFLNVFAEFAIITEEQYNLLVS